MEHIVKILDIENISKNIKKFKIEKPEGYDFVPGAHTAITMNKPGWEGKRRPFSLSSSPKDDFLEFIIKIYPERDAFTKKMDELKVGDEVTIIGTRGKIKYSGKGTFIAAGTGINPFISIFKTLEKEGKLKGNTLFFSNRKADEIIMEEELRKLLGGNILFTLTRELKEGYENERIDKDFLEKHVKDFNQKFYLCGPTKLIVELKKSLLELGVKEENIVSEV